MKEGEELSEASTRLAEELELADSEKELAELSKAEPISAGEGETLSLVRLAVGISSGKEIVAMTDADGVSLVSFK
jgi:hypothetical protein